MRAHAEMVGWPEDLSPEQHMEAQQVAGLQSPVETPEQMKARMQVAALIGGLQRMTTAPTPDAVYEASLIGGLQR